MASEAFLGLKISLGSLRFSLGMVTEFASRPHAWRLVSIGIGSFRYTLGTRRRSGAWKPVNSGSYSEQRLSRMCGHCTLTLLVLRSLHFYFMLVPQSSCGHKSVLALCVFLTYKWKVGNVHHLSQNIGLAIAESARPASSALSERNKCVKETVPLRFKVRP